MTLKIICYNKINKKVMSNEGSTNKNLLISLSKICFSTLSVLTLYFKHRTPTYFSNNYEKKYFQQFVYPSYLSK